MAPTNMIFLNAVSANGEVMSKQKVLKNMEEHIENLLRKGRSKCALRMASFYWASINFDISKGTINYG